MPPLHLANTPTRGPTGARDNLERLYALQSALLPPGRLLVMEVTHDDGCPCEDGIEGCTCETVDVTLRVHNPRES